MYYYLQIFYPKVEAPTSKKCYCSDELQTLENIQFYLQKMIKAFKSSPVD